MALSPYDVEDAAAGAAETASRIPPALQPQTGLPSPMQQAFTQLGGGQQTTGKQLQDLMAMLEARQTQGQIPWFQLAGAFLNPGRTGQFGEAVGRAADVMGQYQAQQEKEQLPLAQMRFELLSRQQQVENQSKALDLMSKGLGMSAPKAAEAVQSGTIPPANLLSMDPQLITAVGALSPEYGKLLQGQFENNVKLVQLAQEDRKQGTSEAELRAKYGDSIINLLPRPAQAAAAAVTPPGGAAAPVPTDDISGLPLAEQAKIKAQRAEEAAKPFIAQRAEIKNTNLGSLEGSNTNLKQLEDKAVRYPRIWGLMQNQGVLAAMASAAQEGLAVDTATWRARVGVPMDKIIEKYKLTPDEQQAMRDVTRLIGSEFLSNVKANKGLLGINPTDNDARLLQAPMASLEDSARAVQYWSRNQRLANAQRADLTKALSEHDRRVGTTANPELFFTSPEYSRILGDYSGKRDQLYNLFNPR